MADHFDDTANPQGLAQLKTRTTSTNGDGNLDNRDILIVNDTGGDWDSDVPEREVTIGHPPQRVDHSGAVLRADAAGGGGVVGDGGTGAKLRLVKPSHQFKLGSNLSKNLRIPLFFKDLARSQVSLQVLDCMDLTLPCVLMSVRQSLYAVIEIQHDDGRSERYLSEMSKVDWWAEKRKRGSMTITEKAQQRGDFIPADDGFYVYWPRGLGDALDERNREWAADLMF